MMYRDFMAAGYRIFPIYRFRTNGKCECGQDDCEAVSKHPRASNWQHTPAWDDEQMETMMMGGYLDTGYGVLCRGLLVVDVDARNGGIASYKKLLADIPELENAGLTVATGSGGGSQHLYFKAPDDVAMVTHLADYPGIDFKSSGYVVGPGSAHKSGGVYVADGYPDDIGDAPQALIDLLKRPERHRSEYNGHAVDLAHADIADMLAHVPNNDLPYEDWIAIGMAIHHATQGSGFDLWDSWSATSGKHDSKQMQYKWGSFGRSANPVTVGTLIHHATENGWVMPVTFVPDQKFNEDPEPQNGLPFDISGVDLTAPPGFVGEVAQWIENQSFRPRKHLAVAGALVTIGNIAGLRYIDDLSSVTSNLFCFCVAGARTGKESIQQAMSALHRAAGLAAAMHGSIKSEQEIIRNLTRHQASFYIVDELGILLSKIRNAQQKGGALYLDGVLGVLMSAYSKANGYMLLTGDAKEAVRADLLKELSQWAKKQDNAATQGGEKRIASIENALNTLDRGLQNPFLSLIGFTTPVTFDGLVDYENATNGFIGRALIFNERETVPIAKRGFKPEPMPDSMKLYMAALFNDGEYDSQALMRVESLEDKIVVPTTAKAAEMLDKVSLWMEGMAEAQKATTALEALYLGAYELVSKVSLILAIPDRLRGEEHVRWAFALVRRDIEEKARMVVGNDSVKHAPKSALQAKILNLTADEGEKEGVILNRLTRTFKKDDVLSALETMVKNKILVLEEKQHKINKSVSRAYRHP
jgi:hypothetical protein